MNITKDCVECIVGQINKATKLLDLDEKLADEINKEVEKELYHLILKSHLPL